MFTYFKCHFDVSTLQKFVTKISFLCSAFLLPNTSAATTEANLPRYLESNLIPLIQKHPVQFHKSGPLNIAFRHFKNNKFKFNSAQNGLVVFLPGRTEPLIKYIELFDDLLKMGHDVLAIDHRGQGNSDREVPHDGGYVNKFSDFSDDAEAIIRKYSNQYENVYGIGQSMGGLVMEHIIFKNRENPIFKKAILSVPMLKINTKPYPSPLAFSIVKFFKSIGQGKSYTLGEGPWKDEVYADTSSSEIRRTIAHSWTADKPRLRVGGATHSWVAEAMWAGKMARKRASKIETPILVFASELDTYVKPEEFEPYCNELASCTLTVFPKSKHEIFQENDSIRDEALRRVKGFFSEAE